MSTQMNEQLSLALWKELGSRQFSPSHDRWHIERVLRFAEQLQHVYGGNLEVITAAAILHDLGRDDPSKHSQESIDASVKHARDLLSRMEYDLPPDAVEAVLQAIDDHDKPNTTPSAIEGRILKDADFLAGFGAWGILRICMWAGETRGGVKQVLSRLRARMPRRLASLEFPLSYYTARQGMLLSNLFLSKLKEEPLLASAEPQGLYIVLEGISGSGKDTQITLLKDRLESAGLDVVTVREPTDTYKKVVRELRSCYGEDEVDPAAEMFLLLGTRRSLVEQTLAPALAEGKVVLSNRSFLSTVVYQETSEYDAAFIALAHGFVPPFSLVVLLDVDADVAFRRIQSRPKLSKHEKPETLRRHRPRYVDVIETLVAPERQAIVGGSQAEEEVAAKIWRVVQPILPRTGKEPNQVKTSPEG